MLDWFELGFCKGTSPDYLWFEPCQGKMKRLFSLIRACVVSELVNLLHTAPPSHPLGNAAFSGTTTKMGSLFLHLDLELSG